MQTPETTAVMHVQGKNTPPEIGGFPCYAIGTTRPDGEVDLLETGVRSRRARLQFWHPPRGLRR